MLYSDFIATIERHNSTIQELQSSVYRILSIDKDYSIAVFYNMDTGLMNADLLYGEYPIPKLDISAIPYTVLAAYAKVAEVIDEWVTGDSDDLVFEHDDILSVSETTETHTNIKDDPMENLNTPIPIDVMTYMVQVNGKRLAQIEVPAGTDKFTVEQLALSELAVVRAIGTRTVLKVVFIPGKLVNIIS